MTHSAGEGAYEGLSSVNTCQQENPSAAMECQGVIFEGDWPAFPSDAPAEIPVAYITP